MTIAILINRLNCLTITLRCLPQSDPQCREAQTELDTLRRQLALALKG
jgi:hypothetical protein